MRIPILPLAIFLLGGAAAAQTTFFADAINGNDGNSGRTRALAVKSITKAATLLSDDDTLIVLPGTYSSLKTAEVFPIQIGDPAKPSTQKRVKIIGEGGPAVTILDGGAQMTSAGKPILRFRWNADGSSITGFTFQNTGTASFWSMVMRLGSTSGNLFATRNIEVHGNVFRNIKRAIVIFGTNPSSTVPNQTSGVKIHDNLVLGATSRPFAIWGDGVNYVYNNTIIKPTGADGIYVDSLWPPASKALIANNIVHAGTGNGITAGNNAGKALGKGAAFRNNNSFKNAANYLGKTFHSSNTSVDPLFVSETGGNFHLKTGSPMIQKGTATLPVVSFDLDRFSRAHDSDLNGSADIDVGAYQFTRIGMALSGKTAPGGSFTFTFTAAKPGIGIVLLGTGEGAITVQPFGVLLIDPAKLLSFVLTVPAPGSATVAIPNNPTLLGLKMVFQGGYSAGAKNTHLINGHSRTL